MTTMCCLNDGIKSSVFCVSIRNGNASIRSCLEYAKGIKKGIAELGGKNAIIIDDDADLDEAGSIGIRTTWKGNTSTEMQLPREFTATNHSVVNRDNCPQLIAVHRKVTQ
mgnify:CR=1 FL=1